MSDTETKDICAELPAKLVVELKVDAIKRGMTIKQWLEEAIRVRLRESEIVYGSD